MINDADLECFKDLALFCRANRITRAKLNNMEIEIELPELPKGEGEELSGFAEPHRYDPVYQSDIFDELNT